MEQILEVKATIPILIPDDKILIDKVEYQELKKGETFATCWDMKEFSRRSGWSPGKLDSILRLPQLRKQIDIDKNDDGWVYFPEGKGDHWWFIASKAAAFIENDSKTYLKRKV